MRLGQSPSPEARALLEEMEREAREASPILISAETVQSYRMEHLDRYQRDYMTALLDTGATTSTIDLGVVPALEVVVKRTNDAAGLYFFGGAFVAGGPHEDITITAPIAADLGIPIYGPFYPLSPENVFPAALDAGVAAYEALLARFEPGQLVIFGQSAGGNLSVAVTLKAMLEGLPPPAAVVALSPAVDLEYSGRSVGYDSDPSMPLVEGWREVMDHYVGDGSKKDPLVSPIHAEYSPDFPPTLITTGTRDALLSDCARLSSVMRRGGVEVTLHVWEEMWHVFEHSYHLPEGAASRREIAAFMALHLGLALQGR